MGKDIPCQAERQMMIQMYNMQAKLSSKIRLKKKSKRVVRTAEEPETSKAE